MMVLAEPTAVAGPGGSSACGYGTLASLGFLAFTVAATNLEPTELKKTLLYD